MLKPAKCSLFRPSVAFLGHLVSAQGINTDPEKVRAIAERPEPHNLEELRSFLGMAEYYRGHIQDFAQMATPLQDLTKKNCLWKWGPLESEGYRGLVTSLMGDTILSHPQVEEEEEGWIVNNDVSGYTLGVFLSQVQDEQEQVIQYASKGLSSEQRRYCTTKREIEVEYRPGQSHGNADALSRTPAQCDTRGCICLQAHDDMWQGQTMTPYDGEPDYENCPGIPTPKSKLIALVTRSTQGGWVTWWRK
jgi:hypothetical protein